MSRVHFGLQLIVAALVLSPGCINAYPDAGPDQERIASSAPQLVPY